MTPEYQALRDEARRTKKCLVCGTPTPPGRRETAKGKVTCWAPECVEEWKRIWGRCRDHALGLRLKRPSFPRCDTCGEQISPPKLRYCSKECYERALYRRRLRDE